MWKSLFLIISISSNHFHFTSSNLLRNQVQNQNNIFAAAANRQVGGISFAIPGLNLLAGNNVGVGGNLFGPVTVTRTLVSTVSTVTTVAYRTCTTTMQALMPCGGAGRRKRAIGQDNEITDEIKATPTIHLAIGSTTITDQAAVSLYLEAHKPSSQSIIYPPGFQEQVNPLKMNPRLETNSFETTALYPSQDTPDATESFFDDTEAIFSDDDRTTTETPYFHDEQFSDTSETEGTTQAAEIESDDKARVGLGRTTTVTTVIRVTSVATTFATASMSTLQITYGGCLPASLPVSGIPCTT